MKNDNYALPKAKEELVLTNTKFTDDQQVFEGLIGHYQLKGEEVKERIDRLVPENQRLYSENQQLAEAKELLAIDSEKLQAVQGQLDLAMARLNRHVDA